jgi:hypothetical protein
MAFAGSRVFRAESPLAQDCAASLTGEVWEGFGSGGRTQNVTRVVGEGERKERRRYV